jgi:triosephosphate isomerase
VQEDGWQNEAMLKHPTTLIANWKMHGDAASVRAFAFAINQALNQVPLSLTVVFCPPTPYLREVLAALPQNRRLGIGGQDCHAHPEGAYTGDVSALMLADCGAGVVILGHSERRAVGEKDAHVAQKATAAIAAGLMPVVCVGESRAEYEAGHTATVLSAQLAGLRALAPGSYSIAYEPVWAIGSGKTPSMPEISAAHRHIKTVLGSDAAVLYGGSVNAPNIAEILALPEVAGALIGSASRTIESMLALIAAAVTKGK